VREGDATFSGQRLSGTARWMNGGRSDGVNQPDVHGVIRTDDEAFVLFTLQGRTLLGRDDKRRQLLTVSLRQKTSVTVGSTPRSASPRASSAGSPASTGRMRAAHLLVRARARLGRYRAETSTPPLAGPLSGRFGPGKIRRA
jgi:hypothetical protein